MARTCSNNDKTKSSANIGFEAKLWLADRKVKTLPGSRILFSSQLFQRKNITNEMQKQTSTNKIKL